MKRTRYQLTNEPHLVEVSAGGEEEEEEEEEEKDEEEEEEEEEDDDEQQIVFFSFLLRPYPSVHSLSSVLSFSPPFLFPFIFLLTSFIVVFIAFVLEDVLSVISMKSSYLYHIQLIVYLVAIRHSICVHSCHNTFSSFHYSFIFKASVANLRAIGINSNSC